MGEKLDLLTHFLVPYIILVAVKSKNKLAGAFGGISPILTRFLLRGLEYYHQISFYFSHRGITHSFIFGFVTSTIFLYVISRKQVNQFIGNIIKRDITVKFTKTTIAIAYFGVLTHLFLDYLTTLGIPLFFPFSITRYALNLYQSLDLITIILAAIVMLIIYMKINYKYKKAAMAIFMIILISFGGLRAYEKINILDDETPTLNGNYNQVALYPTSNIFVWNVVKSNSQNSSYIVSQYNGWSNQNLIFKHTNTPFLGKMGDYSAGLNAIKIADNLPVVKQLQWNSYYTVVNAQYNSNKWEVTL